MTKTIVLITGPSGSGKTTLMQEVFEPAQLLRSATTRNRRPDEKDSVDYLFTSKAAFERLLKAKQLIQFVKYQDNYYGVPKTEADEKLRRFDTVVVPIVYQAIPQFGNFAKDRGYKLLPVFCDISYDRLSEHFKSRLEPESAKQKRLALYQTEIANRKFYDPAHILNMDPDDHAKSAGEKLKKLLKKG